MTTREEKIVTWTRAGAADATYDGNGDPNGPGDTDFYEDEVYWGFWTGGFGDVSHPPSIIFRSEEQAKAYAEFIAESMELAEYHVGPVVLTIAARDNFEVPE